MFYPKDSSGKYSKYLIHLLLLLSDVAATVCLVSLLDKSYFPGYALTLSRAQNCRTCIQIWMELQVIALENHVPSVLLVFFVAVWGFVCLFSP